MSASFAVGDQVNVESRTWPGINKPGGVGKVIKVHADGSIVVAVDVKYILGGTEKEVELQYVKKHEELDRGGRSRPRREVMNLAAEEKKTTRRAAGNKEKASSEAKQPKSKGKTNAKDATKKRKTAAAGKPAQGKKKKTNRPAQSSTMVAPSDSDSVVVSADESEITPPSYKPAATKKAAAAKPPAPSNGTSSAAAKRSNVIPQETRLDSKPTKSKPKPKLTKVDKNTNRSKSQSTGSSMGAAKGQSTLKRVHETNSRAATNFVDDIVGGGAAAMAGSGVAAKSATDDASPAVHEEQSNAGNTHSTSVSLTLNAQRRQLFCTSLNDVMMKRMVEEMSIDEILTRINSSLDDQKPSATSINTDASRPFTNLEIRSFLNELDMEQKIMVTWDTGTVYKI